MAEPLFMRYIVDNVLLVTGLAAPVRLALPRLWDMKTGGILSRITGDVDTTTGLLQLAIVSPAVSVIRLVISVVVLMVLNWRLALTALAILPGIVLISFISA